MTLAPVAAIRSRILAARAALMPDYGDAAAAFWLFVVVAGVCALAAAMAALRGAPTGVYADIVWAGGCAALAGLFPIRFPRTGHSFAAGEIFIFLLLQLHGWPAATVAAAAESAIASWRTSRRWTSRILSPALAALSLAVCGAALDAALAAVAADGADRPGALSRFAGLLAFGAADFAMTTLALSTVVALKRGERPRLNGWWADFSWVGAATLASASVAGLLGITTERIGAIVPLAAAPMIALFVASMRIVFSQQRADEAERRARVAAAEGRFEATFMNASIGMALVAADGALLQVNRAFCTLAGVPEAEALRRRFVSFIDPAETMRLEGKCAALIADRDARFGIEVRRAPGAGGEGWWALYADAFDDASGGPPCLILQVQDVTARRLAEQRLHHVAYHDGLTELSNRTRFNELLAGAIARQRQDPEAQFAVLFLDFDRFKLVNDSLGHRAGDEFLVQVAQRIRATLRRSDEVARLGGDEFAILLQGRSAARDAPDLADRLQAALALPLDLRGTEIIPSASIGITTGAIVYETPEEVLRDADIAMYRAKASGKGRHALFDASLRAQVGDQLQIEADLRRAIDAGDLAIALQPLNRLDGNRIVGFESLARWQHATRGWISPGTFIPIAEESGLIVPLSDRMLELSCRQLATWHARDPALRDLRVHVNASGAYLARSGFTKHLEAILSRTGLPPSALTLEITESVLMDRVDSAMKTIGELRELGVALSVDDFGTGYSSLSYLSALPISSLKIDASFVRRMGESRQDAEIVRAVVSLGGALAKRVIAEGIETEAQLQQLRELGCEFGQGYLFARPLPPMQADALVVARLENERAAAVSVLRAA